MINLLIDFYLSKCVDYPRDLHDAHTDYPFAPERMRVHPDMLFPHQLNLLGVDNPELIRPSKMSKLIPKTYMTNRTTLYTTNLKEYTKQGMILKSRVFIFIYFLLLLIFMFVSLYLYLYLFNGYLFCLIAQVHRVLTFNYFGESTTQACNATIIYPF